MGILAALFAPSPEAPSRDVFWIGVCTLVAVYPVIHLSQQSAQRWCLSGRTTTTACLLALFIAGAASAYAEWEFRPLEVKIIFKNSTLLSASRKRHISHELDDYYRYLEKLEFTFSKEIPPIALTADSLSTAGGSEGPTYYSSITIPANVAENPSLLLTIYSSYIFNRALVWPDYQNPQKAPSEVQNDETAAWVYQCYFPTVFSRQQACDSRDPGYQWVKALQEVRRNFGSEYTDKLLVYSFKMWRDVPSNQPSDFDQFFRKKLLSGESVIDNPIENQTAQLDEIFKRNGIRTLGP